MVLGQLVESSLQRAFDLLHWQRFTNYPSGKWQHGTFIDTGQLSQGGAGARGILQARFASTSVGVTGIGQQITHAAQHPLLGQNDRRSAERIESKHTRYAGAFGTSHHYHVLAPRAFDARRGNAQLKTWNRVQGRQRAKTNSHRKRSLRW